MMAKRRDDRYKDVEELLMDLEALRNGQPPLQAHKRFDVSVLQQLEKGEAVETEQESYAEETLARYRMAILILGTAAAVSVLIIILLLLF